MTQNTEIIIADNQDITCAGLIHACMEIGTQQVDELTSRRVDK